MDLIEADPTLGQNSSVRKCMPCVTDRALLTGLAAAIPQTYSRLVVDCNRRPDAGDAVAPVSDRVPIPGNADLSVSARVARFAEVHEPYHARIDAELRRRAAAGMSTVLIALHSFTPALAGAHPRPWHVGVLHDRGDPSFARTLIGELRRNALVEVGDNEPYRLDAIDYTIPRHAYSVHLPYAELATRQDLIHDPPDQQRWADILTDALSHAQPVKV